MPMKIFDLAKELDVGALDLVEKLKGFGLKVRNHMSSLSDEDVQKARELMGEDKKKVTTRPKKIVKKAVKKVKSAQDGEGDAGSKDKSKEVEAKSSSDRKVVTVKRKASSKRISEMREDEEESGDHFPTEDQIEETASTETESFSIDLKGNSVGFKFEDGQEASMEEMRIDAQKGVPEDKKSEVIAAHGNEEKVKIEETFKGMRGLQVVYRPPAAIEVKPTEINAESEMKGSTVGETEQKSEKGPKAKGDDREFFEEKMHSFTPIYIPPKKVKEEVKPLQRPSLKGKETSDEAPELQKDDDKADSKKRLGGLAAMMAKPKVSVKAKDRDQIRADEELKSYGVGLVGKVIYSPVGRKRVYNGPSKETNITEVKDSKRVLNVHKGLEGEELARKLKLKFSELRDRCLDINLLLRPDDYLGLKLVKLVADLYNFRVEDISFQEKAALVGKTTQKSKSSEKKVNRNPIITIMGHVDHGKTTLLDYIRKAKVAKGEAGGITQHVGAYTVEAGGKTLTFLDTPGHAAFSAIRERGAKVTDIVVLVVAADDGVMPQTRESVQFCQTHKVPMIVAVNKMDKEGINPDRVKQGLSDLNVLPEEWGGETQFVPISALNGSGIDHLLDSIALQAEIMELVGESEGKAEGMVIESKLEIGRGPVVTVIVQKGTLKQGDSLVVGESFGRARSLMDTNGKIVQEAGPSVPVQIVGLNNPPLPGDMLNVVDSEREAKRIVENRMAERKELELMPKQKMSLEDFFNSTTHEEEKKILKLIVRADVAGSFEAIKSSVQVLGNAEVGVEVISGGTGAITDSDVQLADSANGYIIGFNMRPVTSARKLAEDLGVDIKNYSIIYELINDVKLALEGLLAPVHVERYIGRAEVRDTFSIPNVGTIAGSAVIDGKIARGCKIRLLRNGKIIFDGRLSSLKRFKDDVPEVKNGYECGISLENFDNVKVQDIFEAYILDEKKPKLDGSFAQ